MEYFIMVLAIAAFAIIGGRVFYKMPNPGKTLYDEKHNKNDIENKDK